MARQSADRIVTGTGPWLVIDDGESGPKTGDRLGELVERDGEVFLLQDGAVRTERLEWLNGYEFFLGRYTS